MNANAHIALLGWIPFVVALFSVLHPRRAVIAAFLIAWLFLPMGEYTLPGLPNYEKIAATSYGVLLGILIFDASRLLRYQPSAFDLPVAIWCCVAFISSVSNGLGVYDGISATVSRIISWGVPYLVGRLYFNDLKGLRELAIGILIGGIVYAPFCLWEVRMSPRLHRIVYGFHQHSFRQGLRYGGYRPIVFMQHGLAVGVWMAGACLLGAWLWWTNSLKRIRQVPMGLIVPFLALVALLCKSIGAILLLVCGLGLLVSTKWLRTALLVAIAVVGVPLYLLARGGLGWDGQELVTITESFDADRAQSLQTRFDNENQLLQRAWRKPLFGWGGWGDFRNVEGGERIVTDSLWIITFGQGGLAALALLISVILLPVCLFLWRTGMRNWHHPVIAPAAALAVLLLIFMLDGLVNAMFNPIYLLAAGGLTGLCRAPARQWAVGSDSRSTRRQRRQWPAVHPRLVSGPS